MSICSEYGAETLATEEEWPVQEGVRAWSALLRGCLCRHFRCVISDSSILLLAHLTSEEKTGHPIKLFEYCSGDTASILERRRHVGPLSLQFSPLRLFLALDYYLWVLTAALTV